MNPNISVKDLLKEGMEMMNLLQNHPRAVHKKAQTICDKLNKKYHD